MAASRRVTLLLCCAVASVALAVAAPPSFADLRDVPPGVSQYRVFAGADGLTNLVVESIAQDRDGALWLGTQDGVFRFDGERFTHFTFDDGLPSSSTTVVAMAPSGEICVGTYVGLACWNGVRFVPAKSRGLPAVRIQNLVSYGGKLWVATQGAGLYVEQPSGFEPAPGWSGRARSVRALWADAGELVAGDGASVALSTGDGVWRDLGDIGLGGDAVDAVLRDRDGALWIRTDRHLWRLARGDARAADLSDGVPTGYDIPIGATSMVIGPRDSIVVGTDAGMAMREGDHWRIIDRSSGMPASPVRTLFVDREGSLWIGSAGLFQLRGRGLIERYGVANGLPGDIVWSFRRDRAGALWLGTNRCLAHVVDGSWQCLPGTEGRVVRSFAFPPQGGVFVGGAPSDLLYLDPAGHTASLGDFARAIVPNVLALEIAPTGDLWIATTVGLYRLPGAVPGPLERVALPGVRDDARIASLLSTDGQLWATASPGGLAVLDGGAWQLFDKRAGLRDSGVNYVIRRADGRLCAAYSESIGLSCFRYRGGRISDVEHVGTAQGLASRRVYFLGEDRQRRLWVGTGDGVDVVSAGGVDHFDDTDGLAGNDTAATAFLVDPDGSVWLGSTGGATHVLAQHYLGAPPAPRTVVLDGRLGDVPLRDTDGDGPRVPHDRNALAVELGSTSLLDARRVEYQMRMSPLEAAWSTIHERQLHYPGIPPGGYRLELRARIGGGPWGAITALRFTVLPAWWQARWFVVLIALCGLATVASAFTWRQRTLLLRRTRQLDEQSVASFRAVIDQMPDLIAIVRGRNVLYGNRACRRFFGVDPPEDRWEDLKLGEWVHPDDRRRVGELFAQLRKLERPSAELIELRVRSADGSWRICEVSGVLVEIGNALTVIASGRDVTERKRMRAKLLVSDRMASLGTLAAGIAHEINNPLAYVTGNLEAMAETLQSSDQPTVAEREELSTAISEARDGAERVRKIVQGLRSFSRSAEEQGAPVALAGVIESAIRLTGNEVRHRAQLVRELGPTPLVVADDGRLTQVFINLLINAAHAIPEGRSDANRITARTLTDDQGRAVIEIEDTGRGMTPEVAARVFEPFFTTKDVGEGTGLGLSICHGIISGIGGQISIESPLVRGGVSAPGTLVRIVLPPAVVPAAPPPAPAPPPAVAPQSQRRQRVMLVDDEPMVVHTMERLLRRDYDVTVALCGQDAINHITGGARFDAIVSDVMMPNMTGIELIEHLQRLAPDQARRLIFLSGGAFTAEARDRLNKLGAPQLEKPVTAKELRACVMRVAAAASGASSG